MKRIGCVLLAVSACCGAVGQVNSGQTKRVAFIDRKPAAGLPPKVHERAGGCVNEGKTFFVVSATTKSFARVYGVSDTGESSTQILNAPIEAAGASLVSTFVGADTIVLLVKAWDRDESDVRAHRNERYLLYLLDTTTSGGTPEVISLNPGFRPRSAAIFRSGEIVVAGKDDANDRSLLAVVRKDGTAERFFDAATVRKGTADAGERIFLDGTFVPYEDTLLMVRPGSNELLKLKANGDMELVRLHVPGRYSVHDILNSSGSGTLAVRVRTGEKKEKNEKMRIMEFAPLSGAFVNTLEFEDARVNDVTCATNSSVTAVFPDPDYKPAQTPAEQGTSRSAGVEAPLVIATSKR